MQDEEVNPNETFEFQIVLTDELADAADHQPTNQN